MLNPSKPKLTILGLSTTCPDGTSEGCKGEFLMTAVKDIVSSADRRVGGGGQREGGVSPLALGSMTPC